MAFIPEESDHTRDRYLKRARFLAISDFGPGSLVYHEGRAYRVGAGLCWAPPAMPRDAWSSSRQLCVPPAAPVTLMMGPGDCRFKHYLLLGGVLAVITWLVTLAVTPLVWPLNP